MNNEKEFKEAVTQFTVEIYKKIIEKQTDKLENSLFSPMSIYTATLLVMVGTDGETLRELQHLLRIPKSLCSGDVHKSFGPLITNYFKSSEELDLSLANKLFLLRPIKILPEYTKEVGTCYNSSVDLLDALPDSEAKRAQINAWVSKNTKNKINDLLPPGSIDDHTILAIINALYFRGTWVNPFHKSATSECDFHCLNGDVMKVDMMYTNNDFPVASFGELDCMGLKLPFKSTDLTYGWDMLILLPNERNGLPKLLSHLRVPGKLASVLGHTFHVEEVFLHLPKFKIGAGNMLNLRTLFQECGATKVFQDGADFSKLSPSPLSVSDGFHQAILEVDEEGATAAAASAFCVQACARTHFLNITVNHPFLVALICDSTVPVFVGHVIEPEYK